MLKNILGAVILTMVMVSGAFASECNGEIYDYTNGHRSVYPSDSYSKTDSKNVKVCVDSEVSSLWNVAVKKAINNLNDNLSSLNTTLHYSYGTSNCMINIYMSGNLPSYRFAQVGPYYNLEVGSVTLWINENNGYFKMNKRKSILMHELLHGAGFFIQDKM